MIIDSGVATGSLQVSGSLSVTGSSNFNGNIAITGGLSVSGPITGAITGSITNAVSASYAVDATNATNAPFYVLTASYTTDSSSLSTRTTNLESTASTLTTASASFALVSASFSSTSGSLSTRTTNLESTASTLTTASASFVTQLNGIAARTGSYATTGSNTFVGTQYIQNTTNATNFGSTAAVYTDGGLSITKDAFISGGLSIAGNLTVFGTSSVNYITSSVLLGLEFLSLNTDLPALRYAGINVGDSGSAAGISSSLWYDSAKDNWLYVYAPNNSSQQTSSLAINGPITYNNVGNEQGLLGNYIVKSQLVTADNNHHITSSQIFDNGTTVAIAGNLQVTGSLFATASQAVSASYAQSGGAAYAATSSTSQTLPLV